MWGPSWRLRPHCWGLCHPWCFRSTSKSYKGLPFKLPRIGSNTGSLLRATLFSTGTVGVAPHQPWLPPHSDSKLCTQLPRAWMRHLPPGACTASHLTLSSGQHAAAPSRAWTSSPASSQAQTLGLLPRGLALAAPLPGATMSTWLQLTSQAPRGLLHSHSELTLTLDSPPWPHILEESLLCLCPRQMPSFPAQEGIL